MASVILCSRPTSGPTSKNFSLMPETPKVHLLCLKDLWLPKLRISCYLIFDQQMKRSRIHCCHEIVAFWQTPTPSDHFCICKKELVGHVLPYNLDLIDINVQVITMAEKSTYGRFSFCAFIASELHQKTYI